MFTLAVGALCPDSWMGGSLSDHLSLSLLTLRTSFRQVPLSLRPSDKLALESCLVLAYPITGLRTEPDDEAGLSTVLKLTVDQESR